MERKQASDFHSEVLRLFDQYVHGLIDRRGFLERAARFATDALTPLGGYPGDEDKARELFARLDQGKALEDFVAAVAWLKARPECTGRVGVVGFCWGGGIANMLATHISELSAAVPFYGS